MKSDGTESEVHPQFREFTNVELHQYVGGFLTGITLTSADKGGLYMFMDDESIVKGKPFNQAATALLYGHRKDHERKGTQIFGDVVVAGIDETGDE